ncbi:MAG: hypothetical protein IJ789_00650 [Bacteroidales bacterium]|nr:hypothetical protein [Bacteroidales bacterium]
MRRQLLIIILLALSASVAAQEVLVPSGHRRVKVVSTSNNKAPNAPLVLPFFDDFSNYTGAPSTTLWADHQAYVGHDYGPKPPTVGMVTLDAIDEHGSLHAGASTSIFGADTLTSLPIRLDTLFADTTRALGPADSIVFSFYYLPGGGGNQMWQIVGDTPQEQDSLILEFYRAADSSWTTAWQRGGISVDTLVAQTGHTWQYVAIAVTDTAFFNAEFRFRFRNYCSLPTSSKPGRAANCDQWNIDYVMLDHSRSVLDTTVDDIAFVDPAPTMLAHYRAMPARQYRTSDMATSLAITITNLYHSPIATSYAYTVADSDGNTLDTYSGGNNNAPPFNPGRHYQQAPAHASPAVTYHFDEGNTPRTYTITHVVSEGSGDIHTQNDTIVYHQIFDNYYAYDDGTPENGYGLSANGNVAYRFDLNVRDTLTAVDFYFNSTHNNENLSVPFRINVWQANDDGTPGTRLYRDTQRRFPKFDSLNTFCRYRLESPVVVDGRIFVGFEQLSPNFINLGFDRSLNTSDRIYCLYGSEWEPSFLAGSLMIRPCFGQSALLGTNQAAATTAPRAYPTLASNVVNIEGMPTGGMAKLLDMTGHQVATTRSNTLDVSHLRQGLYMLLINDNNNVVVGTIKIAIVR